MLLEVKNEIEKQGGYIEVTLNPNLLQVSPTYLLDLIALCSPEKDRKALREIVRAKYISNEIDVVAIEHETFADRLKKLATETSGNCLEDILSELSKQGINKIVKSFVISAACKKMFSK